MNTAENPEVTKMRALDMQVCVPESWTDEQAQEFANAQNPAGTQNGWKVRKDPGRLNGCPERNPCAQRPGYVHISMVKENGEYKKPGRRPKRFTL